MKLTPSLIGNTISWPGETIIDFVARLRTFTHVFGSAAQRLGKNSDYAQARGAANRLPRSIVPFAVNRVR